MPSRRQQAVGAAMDAAALLADGREAARNLELLIRAVSRRRLWHELAWEPDSAEAEALRDVARVRRALDVAGARVGEYGE